MVLDIRQLHLPEPPEETPAPVDSGSSDAGERFEQLLERAAVSPEPQQQTAAIAQLRQIIPGPEGEDLLWTLLAEEGNRRRLVAAQMLGYHRQWLTSRSRLRQMVALARGERDRAIGGALVWCLRQRSEIGEFLCHESEYLARESALGLPLNRQTLPHLLQALFSGPGYRPEIERILLSKLRSIHPSLVRDLVDLLLGEERQESPERLMLLFESLPQLPLFEIFLEERQLPAWNDAQQEDASQARRWQKLSRVARQTLELHPSFELVRHLITRSGEEEAFTRRHARFMRGVLQGADTRIGADLIAHLERLTFRATEEKVERLAQLLVELSGKLEGDAGDRAASLLESWKNRSANLKLKIYHLQQELGD